MRTARALPLLVLPSLLVLPLVGCGGDESSAERAIEAAAAAQGEDVDIELSDDGEVVKVETEDGSVSTGTELPADWPAEMPTFDTWEVTSASSVSDGETKGWIVSYLTADGAKATFDMFRNEMTAELGYTEMQATESGTGDQYGAVASFSGAYDVFFTVTVDPSQDGQSVVAMTVNQTNG